jgi:hypothetical protein
VDPYSWQIRKVTSCVLPAVMHDNVSSHRKWYTVCICTSHISATKLTGNKMFTHKAIHKKHNSICNSICTWWSTLVQLDVHVHQVIKIIQIALWQQYVTFATIYCMGFVQCFILKTTANKAGNVHINVTLTCICATTVAVEKQ